MSQVGPEREWLPADPFCTVLERSDESLELWFTHHCVTGAPEPERLPISNELGWVVMLRDPLTITPSIDCAACGTHGWFTAGRWHPVLED